jgi:Cytochrome c3/Cytochrome c7 and related cytochrome c
MTSAMRSLSTTLVLGLLLPAAVSALEPPQASAGEARAETSCVICHSDAEIFEPHEIETVEAVARGIHGEVGLSCHDCHGGNPDPAFADDEDAAMDESYAPNPYIGVPGRLEIPESCAHCHADAEYMKRYKPDIRIDQLREYRTSRHGRLLAQGDTKVATCVDCHGAHGVLAPSAPDSPVYPTQVAKTCAKCHADPEHMAGYTLADGRPLPTGQYAQWQRSVHAAALLEKGDFSAPTCNDCHGNHGATPPGVASIVFVCGQCHAREAELFAQSDKRVGFQHHNEDMEDGSACADCHDDSEPAFRVTGVHRFNECATCHDNHAVVSPRITMLAPLPEIPCVFCHEPGPGGAPAPEAPVAQEHYREVRDRIVGQARAEGLSGAALFDRLIDDARALPFHTRQVAQGARGPRPAFQRLFEKFRLGKTYFSYPDPDTGEELRRSVVSCDRCHAEGEEGSGAAVARMFLDGLHEVTARTAEAERISLRARRGGVSTGGAEQAIDRAVAAQIEMQVLIHAFRGGEDSRFAAKQTEALADTRVALEAGQAARGELSNRRRGLAVSLVVIALVLIGLGWKIRTLGE